MINTINHENSRLAISAGNSTQRIVLPHNTAECIRQINKCTEAVINAGNSIISASIIDNNGKKHHADKFLPWEYLHRYAFSKEKVNSYSLGVILFVFLFHRFPDTAEQELHRHIDYSRIVIDEVTEDFLKFANDYLTRSLCISSICRRSASELHILTCRMLASK